MSKVITFSRQFPGTHPRSGHLTNFVEQIWTGIQKELRLMDNLETSKNNFLNYQFNTKSHTIRNGNRFKKGEYFSARVWSGQPYNSKQIIFADPILITDVWPITIQFDKNEMDVLLNTEIPNQWEMLSLGEVAINDGLTIDNFKDWFNPKQATGEFKGQIICWNPDVKY